MQSKQIRTTELTRPQTAACRPLIRSGSPIHSSTTPSRSSDNVPSQGNRFVSTVSPLDSSQGQTKTGCISKHSSQQSRIQYETSVITNTSAGRGEELLIISSDGVIPKQNSSSTHNKEQYDLEWDSEGALTVTSDRSSKSSHVPSLDGVSDSSLERNMVHQNVEEGSRLYWEPREMVPLWQKALSSKLVLQETHQGGESWSPKESTVKEKPSICQSAQKPNSPSAQSHRKTMHRRAVSSRPRPLGAGAFTSAAKALRIGTRMNHLGENKFKIGGIRVYGKPISTFYQNMSQEVVCLDNKTDKYNPIFSNPAPCMPFPAWQEEDAAQAPLHCQGATEMSDTQSDTAHCSQDEEDVSETGGSEIAEVGCSSTAEQGFATDVKLFSSTVPQNSPHHEQEEYNGDITDNAYQALNPETRGLLPPGNLKYCGIFLGKEFDTPKGSSEDVKTADKDKKAICSPEDIKIFVKNRTGVKRPECEGNGTTDDISLQQKRDEERLDMLEKYLNQKRKKSTIHRVYFPPQKQARAYSNPQAASVLLQQRQARSSASSNYYSPRSSSVSGKESSKRNSMSRKNITTFICKAEKDENLVLFRHRQRPKSCYGVEKETRVDRQRNHSNSTSEQSGRSPDVGVIQYNSVWDQQVFSEYVNDNSHLMEESEEVHASHRTSSEIMSQLAQQDARCWLQKQQQEQQQSECDDKTGRLYNIHRPQ